MQYRMTWAASVNGFFKEAHPWVSFCIIIPIHFLCTQTQFRTFWSSQAPDKRSQHVNATYCNIVESNMHVGLVWPPCCEVLGFVGWNLKMVKFFMPHLLMLHDVVVVWPGLCMLHPIMLRYVTFDCWNLYKLNMLQQQVNVFSTRPLFRLCPRASSVLSKSCTYRFKEIASDGILIKIFHS